MLVAWTLEDMLADLGCDIVGPAARVNQALAIVDAEVIDLAILDINLHGQKSFPIADALAAGGVPFVFLTGYNCIGIPEAYKAYPLLQKPCGSAALTAMLERLIEPT